jgi:hypothetical protein
MAILFVGPGTLASQLPRCGHRVATDQRRSCKTVTLGIPGLEGPAGRGWGTVKPKLIFNGGDASGLVDHIHWRRWGSRAAIGVGRNSIFRPGGGYYAHRVRIVLRASRPRYCSPSSQHLSYTRLTFRAPSRPGGPLPRRWRVWDSDMCRRPSYRPGYRELYRPARVLVANCGTTGYSSVKPDYWSAGCTAGSPTLEPIEWVRYGSRVAVGTGTAIVQDCGCADPTATARYPGRVVLSRPRACRGNPRRRFFSKARVTVTYPEGNPFGESPGDHSGVFHVPRGKCTPSG